MFRPIMRKRPLTVAWISDFPVEFLPDLPSALQPLRKQHPLTWQRVLLREFATNTKLRVHVYAFRRRIAENISFERGGVNFHVIKAGAFARIASLFWTDTWHLAKEFRALQVDLVHAWGSERGAVLTASRLGLPFVATVQGLLSWYQELVPLEPFEHLMALLERRSFRRARVITTESRFAVRYLSQRYCAVEFRQVEHAPNPVFHTVVRRPERSPIRFIYVGTIDYRKGSDLLFTALDLLRQRMEFTLVLIGGGGAETIRSKYPATSDGLWETTEFHQNLSPAEIAEQLAVATMLLFPTRADTSPNAVKEAAVAGVPVIASRVGGIVDYIVDGENGFLFDAGDLAQFVKAIESACMHAMFSKGSVNSERLAAVRQYLSPERMAEEFMAAYDRALSLYPDSGAR